jgi:hypothetical protein
MRDVQRTVLCFSLMGDGTPATQASEAEMIRKEMAPLTKDPLTRDPGNHGQPVYDSV